MSETTIKEAIDGLKQACIDKLVENIKNSLESFDKLDEKKRLNEFGQGQSAIACCSNLIEVFRGLSSEERGKIMKDYPFMKDVFMNVITYIDLGLTFGYTELQKKEQ